MNINSNSSAQTFVRKWWGGASLYIRGASVPQTSFSLGAPKGEGGRERGEGNLGNRQASPLLIFLFS